MEGDLTEPRLAAACEAAITLSAITARTEKERRAAVASLAGKPLRHAKSRRAHPNPSAAKKAPPLARQGTKTATLVALLGRSHGATLADLMQASGWQPHSVRGFLSGALGKKMGRTVASIKRADGQRVYALQR